MAPSTAAEGRWPGAHQFAWTYMLMLWNLGGALGGYLGYFKVLVAQASTAAQALAAGAGPAAVVLSWRPFEGRVAVLVTLLATLIYKTAYAILSKRQGRRLSAVSLLIFPLLNAIGEGFLYLFLFDMGRWYLGNEKLSARVVRWQPAVPALGRITPGDDTFWQEFMMGSILYALANGMMAIHFWQGLVLPDHAPNDALRHTMSLALLIQFGYMAVYFLTGDLLSYTLLRWFGDVLTVLAVRLPPPGAGPEPAAAGQPVEAPAAAGKEEAKKGK